MNLNQLILNTLNDVDSPVEYMTYSGTERTYITFFEYDQDVGLEADDEEQNSVHYIQIDVFSPGNFLSIVKNVKWKMKQARFKKNFETEMYENETKLYHKMLRFYFISETEE
ncbi:hypothetical protein C2I06_09465 [Niallia circulans]|uniref:hypothetical protein n=1 Tax=Niallia circulans TaxID=1397 RepID=UPI000F45E9E6|nr:hypothetical protein [Niallia circulans]AYV67086.1 hypothetical protein C2I06_09465 [Niallia circulans]